MSKQIKFTDNYEELIEEIQQFQKEQKLPSFVEAVRRLCSNGLSMSNVVRNLK